MGKLIDFFDRQFIKLSSLLWARLSSRCTRKLLTANAIHHFKLTSWTELIIHDSIKQLSPEWDTFGSQWHTADLFAMVIRSSAVEIEARWPNSALQAASASCQFFDSEKILHKCSVPQSNQSVFTLVEWTGNKTKSKEAQCISSSWRIYRWLSGKLWYLQHNCVGDTIVYHYGSDMRGQRLYTSV